MAATDYNPILGGSAPPNASALLQALEKRSIYVVAPAENPAALNPGFVLTLSYNGIIFWYDSADATTVHDGVTCIVTADGKRYKSDQYRGVQSLWVAVLDKDLTAPPGSPAIGDSYIVAAGGSGAWATHDKQIATWTARGWAFIIPKAFDYAYVRDEAQIYHYSSGGAWTSGIPAQTIADGSISHKKLKWFPLGIAVENQTTNAPPGAPADGVAYVIGGAPSGAWVGHSLKVAIWEASSSAWAIFTPYEGAQVYDKALNALYTHNGSIWTTPVQNNRVFIEKRTVAAPIASIDFFNLGAYSQIFVLINDLRPVTDDIEIRARLSSDNATFITTASSYNNGTGGNQSFYTLTDNQASGAAVGNAASDGGFGSIIHFTNWNLAQKTRMFSDSGWGSTTGNNSVLSNIAQQAAQTAMQGFQIYPESGNIAQAIVTVEGIL